MSGLVTKAVGDQLTEARLQEAGSRLRLDAAMAEAMARFGQRRLQALVLKGPTIARWLYVTGTPRSYIDCDLLVAPADLARAEDTLRGLGYDPHFDDREMPEWWREHAGEWVRASDGVTIDVHRTLSGVGVSDADAWRILSEDCASVLVAGRELPALSLPGRALHVALHAAQHGIEWAKPIQDLDRAIRQTGVDLTLWRGAADLATALCATERFAAGLRLHPDGGELADRLGLPHATSVDTQLRAESALPQALTIERLVGAPGFRAKAAIALRKLVPPPSYLRKWDPEAGQGRRQMLRAYVRRVWWIARSTPPAVGAWRDARRAVRAARAKHRGA